MQLASSAINRCYNRPATRTELRHPAALFQVISLSGCSSPVKTSLTVSSTSASAVTTPPIAVAAFRRQRLTAVHAWSGTRTTQQLWDYQGSHVKKLSLEELQLLHRLSFGHRNQRSYLVVLHQPTSKACQELEAEIERLATGLRHERAFVAAALDISSRPAAEFATKMLEVATVPAVLLYPEAARGCLRFLGPDMSAAGMLTAINSARLKALPPSLSTAGAAEWQLLEPSTPLVVTALRAAAATGDREAVLSTLQQQMKPIQPTPVEVQGHSSIWSQGRLSLWGGMLLCSLLFLVWDLKLADVWEDWNLLRRQKERARGKRFTFQENLDDFTTILMAGIANRSRADLLKQEEDGLQVPASTKEQEELNKQQYERAGQIANQQVLKHQQQQHEQGQHQQELTMKQRQGGGWVVDQSRDAN